MPPAADDRGGVRFPIVGDELPSRTAAFTAMPLSSALSRLPRDGRGSHQPKRTAARRTAEALSHGSATMQNPVLSDARASRPRGAATALAADRIGATLHRLDAQTDASENDAEARLFREASPVADRAESRQLGLSAKTQRRWQPLQRGHPRRRAAGRRSRRCSAPRPRAFWRIDAPPLTMPYAELGSAASMGAARPRAKCPAVRANGG